MLSPIVLSFIGFLILFAGVGIYSSTRSKTNAEDYLLAGRNVNPWLMALSAVSTNNSGFMFIGLIGMTYKVGLSSSWIMIGWIAGDYLAWLFVHRRLREISGREKLATIPSFLGKSLKSPGDGVSRAVMIVAGIIIVLFLGTYAAAQLKAGGKALFVIFHWPQYTGAIVGAVIVVLYCFSGGIRASIWTDAVQAVVMLCAMALLFMTALIALGGFSGFAAKLNAIDPKLLYLTPQDAQLGAIMFIAGWVFAGLGVVGQPHIMIRAMTIESPEKMLTARRIYFLWYTMFTALAIGVGLAARPLLVVHGAFDAEMALPNLALQLLPEVLVGMILAGLFAATMSTADSQILSCSAALTQDIFPTLGTSYIRVKLGTIFVTLLALSVALFADEKSGFNVFKLVTVAWGVLAASLGPLLILRVLGRNPGELTALIMMFAGLGTVLAWISLGWSGALYEVAPGMLAGLIVYLISVVIPRGAETSTDS